jgi:hypothetical protein
MTRSRLLTLAVVAGVLAGGGFAAVQAAGDEERPPARSAALAPPPSVPVVPTGRLDDGRYDPGRVHLRVHRDTLRESARVKDPGGGPDWVLRSFEAERLTLQRPARTLRGARVVGRNRCVQLGREQGGRFGWVYGDGRFRAISAFVEGQLEQCGSRKRPALQRQDDEILDLSDFAAPRVVREVLWGEAPGARSLALKGTKGAEGPVPVGPRQGFLVVAGGEAELAGGALMIDGRTVPVRRGAKLPERPGAAPPGEVKPGSERVEARTPDPAGGPPIGVLVAETTDGKTCVATDGQIVGDRVGGVDTRLGIFFDNGVNFGRGCQTFPTGLPDPIKCNINTGFGGDDQSAGDPLLRRARIERRILPGRATVRAVCRDEVVKVTLETPRDIRTLAPSPFAHVVFAMYDGDFPTGDLVLTAHLRGGGKWVETFPLGF